MYITFIIYIYLLYKNKIIKYLFIIRVNQLVL